MSGAKIVYSWQDSNGEFLLALTQWAEQYLTDDDRKDYQTMVNERAQHFAPLIEQGLVTVVNESGRETHLWRDKLVAKQHHYTSPDWDQIANRCAREQGGTFRVHLDPDPV